MGAFFLIGAIIGFIIGLLLSWIPLKLVAGWLDAGRPTWKHTLICLIVAWIAAYIAENVILIVLNTIGLGIILIFLIEIILLILLQSYIYSKVLETSLGKGVGIFLLSTLITIVIYIVLALLVIYGFGVSLNKFGTEMSDVSSSGPKVYISVKRFEEAADEVCKCKSADCVGYYQAKLKRLADQADLNKFTDNEREQFDTHMDKALMCTLDKAGDMAGITGGHDDGDRGDDLGGDDRFGGGGGHGSGAMRDGDDGDLYDENFDDEDEDKKDADKVDAPVVEYEFKTMSLEEAGHYAGHPAWVILTDGRVKEGTILRLGEYELQLRQQNYGGYMVSYVPRSKIKEVRVYVRK